MTKIIRLFISGLCLSLIFYGLNLTAGKKNEQLELKKIVVIEGQNSKTSGFITVYQGKIVVVSIMDALMADLNKDLKIKDINGAEMKYDRILVPDDGRNLLMFELDKTESLRPFLLGETDLSNNCSINVPVSVYVYRKNINTVAKVNGKLLSIGPQMVEIEFKKKDVVGGGPIILRREGKFIAVAGAVPPNVKNRLYGIRFDTVKAFRELDMKLFEEGNEIISDFEKKVKTLSELAGKMKKSLQEQELFLDGNGDKISSKIFEKQINSFASVNDDMEKILAKSEQTYPIEKFVTLSQKNKMKKLIAEAQQLLTENKDLRTKCGELLKKIKKRDAPRIYH
jgi:hypothetical protein